MAAPRSRGDRSFTISPSMTTLPTVGRSKPATRLRSVDLPQPLGPTRVTNEPSGISRSMSRSTGAARPKLLLTLSKRTEATRSALHRAGGEPGDEPPLEEQRHQDDRQRGHHRGG